jgi:oxalate decarboxylase/phosphoglucose isomerase-like protein (cupin superfamily)
MDFKDDFNTPRIIQFPKIQDPKGNLTFIQNPEHIPFEIKRTFWTYDIPGGEIRGGHAYKSQEEIIIALSGSFDVIVTNLNGDTEKFSLNRSYCGLYLPKLTWRYMDNFSTNSLSLHLSSKEFFEEDYVREFELFQNLSK